MTMSGPELAAIRRQEQINAANVLGVASVDFYHSPDGDLTNNDDSRKFLTRLVRKYQPVRQKELVFHSPPHPRFLSMKFGSKDLSYN
jgi:LmbE family N-acetylglucosaminyl deacetylase